MVNTGHGNWIARAMQESSGKENYKALGDLSELPDHVRFDAAQKAAQTWFEHLGRGGTAGTPTVADACSRYVRHLRATKSERAANDAEARFKNYVLNHAKLAATELPKLTPTQLEAWRKSLKELPTRSGGRRGQRRSDSTLNRDMTCFRAGPEPRLPGRPADDGLRVAQQASPHQERRPAQRAVPGPTAAPNFHREGPDRPRRVPARPVPAPAAAWGFGEAEGRRL